MNVLSNQQHGAAWMTAIARFWLLASISVYAPLILAGSGNTLPRAPSAALGMADANVALSSGPAAQFINPANLIDQNDNGFDWDIGGALGNVSTSLSRPVAAGFGGAPAGGVDADTQRPFIPFAAFRFFGSERRVFGFSVESPHGLTVEWPNGAYGVNTAPLPFGVLDIAQKAELTSVRLGPAVAIAINDRLSFGARVFGQRVDVLDENDLSTAEGDGTTVGAQLGVRYKTERFIMAAAYTTRTKTKVEGSLKDIHPAATTLVAGDAEVDFLLPDRLQAGIAVPLRPNLWWEFDLDWIGWSYVDELTIVQSNGTIANAGRNTFDSDNTLSVRWGLEWRRSPRLTLHAGLGYDPSPIARIDVSPNVNMLRKIRLGLGGSLLLKNGLRLDFAYQFIRGRRRDISESKQDDIAPLGDTSVFEGEYSSRTHVVGVNLMGHF